MKEEILTAKEWLEKERKLDGICENNPNYKGLSYPASEAMERYAKYKNRILEDRIKEYRNRLKKLSDGEEITRMFVEKGDFVICEILKEYDKHFNIK